MGVALSFIALITIVYFISYLLTLFLEKNKVLWIFIFGFAIWLLLFRGYYGFLNEHLDAESSIHINIAFLVLLPFPYIAGVIAFVILIIKKIISHRKKSSS